MYVQAGRGWFKYKYCIFRLVEDGWSEEVSLEVTQLHAADENLTR